MRLIVMGQQAFGREALAKILAAGIDEVVAVYCAPDKENRPVDPLEAFALENRLAVYQPPSFDDDAVLAQLRAHDADLMIMAYVTIFVPKVVRDIPRQGSICFHPSLLPRHRGPSSINWPIIWGSSKTGYSWFYPTDGLDEGDILLQKDVEIGVDDTLGDVYFKKIFPVAVHSVLEVCDLYRSGKPPRRRQDESKATCESWCRKKDAVVDWSRPVAKVYNLIRGCNPQPGAWTTAQGTEVQIYESRKVEGEGDPGAVVAISEKGVTVQAQGGRILIRRVRLAGGDKIAAGAWALLAGITVGAKLGS